MRVRRQARRDALETFTRAPGGGAATPADMSSAASTPLTPMSGETDEGSRDDELRPRIGKTGYRFNRIAFAAILLAVAVPVAALQLATRGFHWSEFDNGGALWLVLVSAGALVGLLGRSR